LRKKKKALTLWHNGWVRVWRFSNATPRAVACYGGKAPKSPMAQQEKNIKNI
jgi:hypothetical protein